MNYMDIDNETAKEAYTISVKNDFFDRLANGGEKINIFLDAEALLMGVIRRNLYVPSPVFNKAKRYAYTLDANAGFLIFNEDLSKNIYFRPGLISNFAYNQDGQTLHGYALINCENKGALKLGGYDFACLKSSHRRHGGGDKISQTVEQFEILKNGYSARVF